MRALSSILSGTMLLAGLDVLISSSGSSNFAGITGSAQAVLSHVLDPSIPLLPTGHLKGSGLPPIEQPGPVNPGTPTPSYANGAGGFGPGGGGPMVPGGTGPVNELGPAGASAQTTSYSPSAQGALA